MWFLILLGTVAVVVYLKIKKSMNYWKDRNVPFIKPLPILGNSAPIVFRKTSFVEHVKYLYNVFPDKRYVGTYGFMKPQILIRDPDLIKKITVKDFDYFTDRTSFLNEETEPLFSKNLMGLKGQQWRDMRSTLSPSFTSSKMKFLFTLILQCAKQFTSHLSNEITKDVVDFEMKDLFSRFTNDAIATAAFGITVDSLKDKENEFFLMGKESTSFSGLKLLKFFVLITSPFLMRLFKIKVFPPALSNFFLRIVKETIQAREEKGIIRPDMIHILLEARKGRVREIEEVHIDEGFAAASEASAITKDDTHVKPYLTDEHIAAQAVLFFFAGFESSSTLMSLLAYELAVHPDVQSRLRREIDETMATNNENISYEVVLRMKYLDMVISEALRKWTPGVALDRVCVKDYEIPAELPEESPLTIEKGMTVSIPILGIHLDAQYFPDPDKFDPERFSDENKNSILPFTYIPFGTGPRNCIASRFALMETKILFFLLLSKLEIVAIKKTPIPMVLNRKGLTMIPEGGLWLGLKQRTNERSYIPE